MEWRGTNPRISCRNVLIKIQTGYSYRFAEHGQAVYEPSPPPCFAWLDLHYGAASDQMPPSLKFCRCVASSNILCSSQQVSMTDKWLRCVQGFLGSPCSWIVDRLIADQCGHASGQIGEMRRGTLPTKLSWRNFLNHPNMAIWKSGACPNCFATQGGKPAHMQELEDHGHPWRP